MPIRIITLVAAAGILALAACSGQDDTVKTDAAADAAATAPADGALAPAGETTVPPTADPATPPYPDATAPPGTPPPTLPVEPATTSPATSPPPQ